MFKKFLSVIVCTLMMVCVTAPVMAQSNSENVISYASPRYTEIRDTSMSLSRTYAQAYMHSWEENDLSIDMTITQNGKVIKHFYDSITDQLCIIEEKISLPSGKYNITCVFTAGNESVTRSKDYTL